MIYCILINIYLLFYLYIRFKGVFYYLLCNNYYIKYDVLLGLDVIC